MGQWALLIAYLLQLAARLGWTLGDSQLDRAPLRRLGHKRVWTSGEASPEVEDCLLADCETGQ